MADYKVGICPNCSERIAYSSEDKGVYCNKCDEYISVEELEKSHNSNNISPNIGDMAGNTNVFQMLLEAKGFGSSESSLIFLENFFETYDWEFYLNDDNPFIDELKEMVVEAKRKSSDLAATWLLEFKTIAIPLKKKISNLEAIYDRIVEFYFIDDGSDANALFDQYNETIKQLFLSKEAIIQTLEVDIRYATRFELEKSQLDEMNSDFESIKSAIELLTIYSHVDEMPRIKERQDAINKKIADEYAALGIDAPKVYRKAVLLYNFEDDKSTCLKMFNQIVRYRDSAKYIDRINNMYSFNRLYSTNGHYFVFGDFRNSALSNTQSTLDVKTVDKDKEKQEIIHRGSDLYEAIDGIISDKPILTDIIWIISAYDGKLFYVDYDYKNNEYRLCSYSFINEAIQVIDTGGRGIPNPYELSSKVFITKSRDQFIFRKKLVVKEESSGCGSKKTDRVAQEENRLNKYQIVMVDMSYSHKSVIINAAVDVYDYYDDKLFYQYRYLVHNSNDEKEYAEKFYIYDVKTHVREELLDRNCFIEAVYNNHIIYSIPIISKSALNIDLHSLSLETHEDIVLEHNAFKFFGIIEGRIYYKVGNEQISTLYSIDFNGETRTEISRNVSKFNFVHSGWLYFTKGFGCNKTLIKMSPDGKRLIRVCSFFSRIITFADGNLFYIDIDDDLRMVRLDGTKNRFICDNVSVEDNIILDKEKVYFLRKEIKEYANGDRGTPVPCKSLYSLSLDGRNLTKIEFNVLGIKDYDEEYFFIYKKEDTDYLVGIPNDKGKYEYKIRTYKRTKYCSYEKDYGYIDDVLVLGSPKPEIKTAGCSGNRKYVYTFKELPPQIYRVRKDVDESVNKVTTQTN